MSAPAPTVPLPDPVREAFVTAALTVLPELLQTEAVLLGDPASLPGPATGPFCVATIGLNRQPPGRLSLQVPTAVAAQLAARFLPSTTPLGDDLVDDALAEFANVIAGQAKTLLKGTPYHFTLTPPTVHRCDGGTMGSAEPAGSALAVIDIESQPLWLVVSWDTSESSARSASAD